MDLSNARKSQACYIMSNWICKMYRCVIVYMNIDSVACSLNRESHSIIALTLYLNNCAQTVTLQTCVTIAGVLAITVNINDCDFVPQVTFTIYPHTLIDQ